MVKTSIQLCGTKRAIIPLQFVPRRNYFRGMLARLSRPLATRGQGSNCSDSYRSASSYDTVILEPAASTKIECYGNGRVRLAIVDEPPNKQGQNVTKSTGRGVSINAKDNDGYLQKSASRNDITLEKAELCKMVLV